MTKYWCEALAVGQRILIEQIRRRRSLIAWSIFPVAILVLNSLIRAKDSLEPLGNSFQQATPGSLVGAGLFFSCMGGTIATVIAEREKQTLKRLLISPLSGISYFLGILIAHSCIGVGQALLIYAIASFCGAQFHGSFLLQSLLILLSIAAYVGIGFSVAAQFGRRTEDVNALVATFGVPLLMLGGAFFPISLLPDGMLAVAQWNPIYHMVTVMIASGSFP